MPNGASDSTLSQTFVPKSPPRTHVAWYGQSSDPNTIQYGRVNGDEQLAMDEDDISSLSSLDADGDEDDEDASFVDHLLVCHLPSRSISASHLAP